MGNTVLRQPSWQQEEEVRLGVHRIHFAIVMFLPTLSGKSEAVSGYNHTLSVDIVALNLSAIGIPPIWRTTANNTTRTF